MNKVVVVVFKNQCDVTEEIGFSTLNLSLFLWTFCKIEKLHQKMALKYTQSEGKLLSFCSNQFQASL